jgi:hypothetical protein
VTVSTAWSPDVPVSTDSHPPGRLWRTALSRRFCARRSSSTGSPAVGAGPSAVRTSSPAASPAPVTRSTTCPATSARSTGIRSVTAFSLSASVSRPSISRSWRSFTSSSARPSRLVSPVASGSVMAESLLLSGLGGLGGLVAGIAATTGYASSQGWPTVVPAWAMAGGLAATLVIGGVAGLYPAMRASRLSPTEALAAP